MSHPDSCRLRARIQRYVDGELSAAEFEAMRTHCETCADCAEQLDALTVVGDRMREVPSAAPLADMWPAVRGSLAGRGSWRHEWRLALGTSALTAAGFLIGFYLGAIRPSAAQPEDLYTSLGSTLPTGGEASLSGQYLEDLSSQGEVAP